MVIIKYIILCIIFFGSFTIGNLISKKFKNRVIELRELKETVNIIGTKIRFTYKPLREIFLELEKIPNNISKIFNEFNKYILDNDVEISWNNAIEATKPKLNLNEEDINIIKSLGKFLR